VLIYFRRDIAAIIGAWSASLVRPERRKDPHARMGWFVIVGTLPIGILGATFQDTIETSRRDLRITATALIVFGLILAIADRSHAVRYANGLTRLPGSAVNLHPTMAAPSSPTW
jgi:undecaprenyl-diphosphatase